MSPQIAPARVVVGSAIEKSTLLGDVTGPIDNNTISKLQGNPVLATTPTTGQVLEWNGTDWVPATPGGLVTLAGDVTGPSGANTISKLQGNAVAATTPTTGQVLEWNGTDWVPFTLPTFQPLISVVTTAVNYAAVNGNVVLVTANAVTVTAPAAAINEQITVKCIAGVGDSTTLVAPAAATIDGGASVTINNLSSYTIVCDGTNWWII